MTLGSTKQAGHVERMRVDVIQPGLARFYIVGVRLAEEMVAEPELRHRAGG
jgi:hypothetical protein